MEPVTNEADHSRVIDRLALLHAVIASSSSPPSTPPSDPLDAETEEDATQIDESVAVENDDNSSSSKKDETMLVAPILNLLANATPESQGSEDSYPSSELLDSREFPVSSQEAKEDLRKKITIKSLKEDLTPEVVTCYWSRLPSQFWDTSCIKKITSDFDARVHPVFIGVDMCKFDRKTQNYSIVKIGLAWASHKEMRKYIAKALHNIEANCVDLVGQWNGTPRKTLVKWIDQLTEKYNDNERLCKLLSDIQFYDFNSYEVVRQSLCRYVFYDMDCKEAYLKNEWTGRLRPDAPIAVTLTGMHKWDNAIMTLMEVVTPAVIKKFDTDFVPKVSTPKDPAWHHLISVPLGQEDFTAGDTPSAHLKYPYLLWDEYEHRNFYGHVKEYLVENNLWKLFTYEDKKGRERCIIDWVSISCE